MTSTITTENKAADIARFGREIVADTDASSAAEMKVLATIKAKGRRTFKVVSGDYEHECTSRSGLTPEKVIKQETKFMRGCLPEGYEDRAIWEITDTYRIVAVVRPGLDGVPLVTRF
jgi:hypothetical protein